MVLLLTSWYERLLFCERSSKLLAAGTTEVLLEEFLLMPMSAMFGLDLDRRPTRYKAKELDDKLCLKFLKEIRYHISFMSEIQ